MKMIFKLSERQLKRAKDLLAESSAAYREVLGEFTVEQWIMQDGSVVNGYYNDIKNKYYIWLGVFGFLQVTGKNAIPDLEIVIRKGELTIESDRTTITRPDVVDKVASVLGKAWRVAEPTIEGEELSVKLFWWESMEHYTKWRSDWNTYFTWLTPQIDPEMGIQKFDDRFPEENSCLQLLKSGKLNEARNRFPKIADQILKIA